MFDIPKQALHFLEGMYIYFKVCFLQLLFKDGDV